MSSLSKHSNSISLMCCCNDPIGRLLSKFLQLYEFTVLILMCEHHDDLACNQNHAQWESVEKVEDGDQEGDSRKCIFISDDFFECRETMEHTLSWIGDENITRILPAFFVLTSEIRSRGIVDINGHTVGTLISRYSGIEFRHHELYEFFFEIAEELGLNPLKRSMLEDVIFSMITKD